MAAKKKSTKKRKFSLAQLAAQKRFAAMAKARSKAAKKKRATGPVRRKAAVTVRAGNPHDPGARQRIQQAIQELEEYKTDMGVSLHNWSKLYKDGVRLKNRDLVSKAKYEISDLKKRIGKASRDLDFLKRKLRANPARRRNKTIIKKARKVIVLNPRKKAAKRTRKNPNYTVEAQPKYTSTVRREVKALTRGSAIRKVQREVKGPKNVYSYWVTKNPRKVAKKKSTKRNPTPAQNRREFAGKYTGDKTLYFPDGTPAGLSKLGKLILLKTQRGIIKPAKGQVWLCRDTAGKLHLGSTTKAPLFSGPAGSLGEVKRLEYQEAKPHLGYKNPVVWFHKMGEETGERPTLHSDGKGGLKFRGGKYRITSRGIEN